MLIMVRLGAARVLGLRVVVQVLCISYVSLWVLDYVFGLC